MSNAGLVVFHRPYPRFDNHYRTQFDLFFEYAKHWLKFLDTLYIIDGGWMISPHPRVKLIHADHMLHWDYFRIAVPEIKEDQVVLLDPDMLVYDPSVIKEGFEKLDEFDCSAILDNSGQAHLEQRFSILQANENRAVRQRITPYLCFIKTSWLLNKDFTPVQDKFDSLGKFTEQVLTDGLKLHELRDDRSTLRLDKDGIITCDSWLDGGGYKWSEPLDAQVKLGYYHVRNSTLGLSLLTEWQHDRQAYERRKAITPFQEAMRLLAWQWIYDEKANQLIYWDDNYDQVLSDWGVTRTTWIRYINHFYEYHSWLKEKPKVTK